MWDAGHDEGDYIICELAKSWKIFLWMLSETFVGWTLKLSEMWSYLWLIFVNQIWDELGEVNYWSYYRVRWLWNDRKMVTSECVMLCRKCECMAQKESVRKK
jgi:hypothetical protein